MTNENFCTFASKVKISAHLHQKRALLQTKDIEIFAYIRVGVHFCLSVSYVYIYEQNHLFQAGPYPPKYLTDRGCIDFTLNLTN